MKKRVYMKGSIRLMAKIFYSIGTPLLMIMGIGLLFHAAKFNKIKSVVLGGIFLWSIPPIVFWHSIKRLIR